MGLELLGLIDPFLDPFLSIYLIYFPIDLEKIALNSLYLTPFFYSSFSFQSFMLDLDEYSLYKPLLATIENLYLSFPLIQ